MPKRIEPLLEGTVHHIYNRGVHKNRIFHNNEDYVRLYETLLFYKWYSYSFSDYRHLWIKAKQQDCLTEFIQDFAEKHRKSIPVVDVYVDCLMPNHFHLVLKQLRVGGIESYLMKVVLSYVQYFNQKYELSGSLFQGPFKNVLVTDESHMLYLSKYIHLNPVVAGLADKPEEYAWSSLRYYLNKTTDWQELINSQQIDSMVGSAETYWDYIHSEFKQNEVDILEEISIDDDFGWY